MGSSISTEALILSIVDKYIFIILYIFGSIGSGLNIYLFLQKRFRIKSCSIYFLANSIVDFLYLNSFILLQIFALFNFQIAQSISSTKLWCKFGNYAYFLLPCLASTYMTFASIDRFCSSSRKTFLHRVNRIQFSYIIVFLIFILWSLFSLHIPIFFDRIQSISSNSIQCTPPIQMATIFIVLDGYFFSLFNGIFNPCLLIVFGLLIFRNIRVFHRRIQTENQILTQGNRNFIRMILVQMILTIFLHIPYIVLYLYGIDHSVPNNFWSLFFYQLFTYIARWFWSLNFSKSFYINLLSSQTFRKVLREKCFRYRSSIDQQVHIQPSNRPPVQTNINSDFVLTHT